MARTAGGIEFSSHVSHLSDFSKLAGAKILVKILLVLTGELCLISASYKCEFL